MVAIMAMLTLLANREPSRRWGSSGAYIAPILLTAGSVDQVLPGPNLWIVTRGELVLAGVQVQKSTSA